MIPVTRRSSSQQQNHGQSAQRPPAWQGIQRPTVVREFSLLRQAKSQMTEYVSFIFVLSCFIFHHFEAALLHCFFLCVYVCVCQGVLVWPPLLLPTDFSGNWSAAMSFGYDARKTK
jgi:hypothetical protein